MWTMGLRRAVGAVPTEGVFWMSYSDVLKYFSAVEVCKIRDNWDDSRVPLFFGGSPVSFRMSSSMFLISVIKPTWLVLQLVQEDERGKFEEEEGDYHYSDLAFFVTETSANPLKFMDQADDGVPHYADQEVLDTTRHKLNSVTFPTVSRTVHCETFLTDTTHSYLVMPVNFNARGSKKVNRKFLFPCFLVSCFLVSCLT